MRRRWTSVLALMFLAVGAWAQSANRVEIFGGYSSAENDFTGASLYNSVRLNRGWNASVNFKLNRISQFVADFGGYYLHQNQRSGVCNSGLTSCSSDAHTVMFGPQFSLGLHKFTPFAQALLGTALASQNGIPPGIQQNHSFILALGGGVDYGFAHHFALRVQADYLRTNFTSGDNQVSFGNNNSRISAGLAVRF
jgi:opacity protein-like surface antigen